MLKQINTLSYIFSFFTNNKIGELVMKHKKIYLLLTSLFLLTIVSYLSLYIVAKFIDKLPIDKANSFYLYDINNTALVHHINQALKANYTMSKDVDYVVQDGEVIIVDQFTGRLMKGRAFSEGLHQAIEAKEGVKIQQETKTLATITFQNYFRMYAKLSGMTGTAKTEEEEFRNIYNMYVICIPTNKPVERIDASDLVFATKNAKYKAIINEEKTIFLLLYLFSATNLDIATGNPNCDNAINVEKVGIIII